MTPTHETLRTLAEELRVLKRDVCPFTDELVDHADRIDAHADAWERCEAAKKEQLLTALVRVDLLVDALEHCGYDERDCIDCGGPPHNESCRFWKLRRIVPGLFPNTSDLMSDEWVRRDREGGVQE